MATSGTTAFNQTPNGNNGTLVNGPTWDPNVPSQSHGMQAANRCMQI